MLFAMCVLGLSTCSNGPQTGTPSAKPQSQREIQQLSLKSERKKLASWLINNGRVKFANFHVSGRRDRATAYDNIRHARYGAVRRSSYGNAPGGYTHLDIRMLRALKRLAQEGYRIRITELAGGSHSRRSRHYAGLAVDLDYINGKKVRYNNPHYRRFMRRCRQLGATEVLGPGNRGHSSHIHAAWPRR